MKYAKMIALILVLLLFFISAALLYNQYTQNLMQAKSNEDSTASTSKYSPQSSSDATDSNATSKTSVTNAPKEGLNVGNTAYDFTLTSFSGGEMTLSGLRGKVVVLNFWASWCGPCQAEMPDFQALQNDITALGDEADVTILSINLTDGAWETSETATAFLSDNGYTFTVLSDPGSVANTYQISSIPQTFVLTKDGVIAEKIPGSTDRQTLDNAIESARTWVG